MDCFDVNVETRSEVGKGALRKIKSEGLVPGIVYQNGDSMPIALNEFELRKLINKHGDDILLRFSLEGSVIDAKIQELQRDPVSLEIKHIDLIPVNGILH